mgnify:CR=1 FL=1
MSHWSETLVARGACSDAVEWARTQPDFETAWNKCKRGDWMIWLLQAIDKTYTPRLRLIACDCARAVLHLTPAGEDRPRLAIECAERYARGEATAEELSAARAAAWAPWSAAGSAAGDAAGDAAGAAWAAARAAAWAAWAAAGSAAGDAAGDAGSAAGDAAGAAAWAAAWDARDAAWAAARAAAWDAAWDAAGSAQADIVRARAAADEVTL